MKNTKISSALRIAVGGIIVLILGGLSGWYFYLHSQQQATATADTGRGLGAAAPSFQGTTGSTQVDQAIAAHAFGSTDDGSSGTSSSELWRVDGTPVAGMGFVDTATDEYLYYAERANGYIFSAHPSQETTERLTDTLMPKIYEAQFADDGSVIERSVDAAGNVTTFLGMISTSTTASASSTVNASAPGSGPATLVGSYLAPDIQEIALDRSSRALFYLVADPKGGVDGISVQWNGTKKKQIFSSIVGSWRSSILDDGTIVLLESPADGMPGYAYTLGSDGTLAPLIGGIPGLTALPKASSALLLYGASSGSALSLFARATSTVQTLAIATVADKCVWLPGPSEIAYCAVPDGATPSDFLDNWYQGTADTSDDWWEIDLSDGQAQRIYSPSADNVSLDVEDPIIDPSGNYIAFKNAADQSLWVLHVAQ